MNPQRKIGDMRKEITTMIFKTDISICPIATRCCLGLKRWKKMGHKQNEGSFGKHSFRQHQGDWQMIPVPEQ